MSATKELLFGIEVDAIDDGHVALEVVALVKVMDPDGHECWMSRGSQGVSDFEKFGILTFEAERIKDFHVRNFVRNEDEDE